MGFIDCLPADAVVAAQDDRSGTADAIHRFKT